MIGLTRLFSVLSLVALFGAFLSGSGVQAQPTTRTVTETADLGPDGEVEVHAVRGEIQVTAWDRSTVRMRAEIEGDSPEQVNDTDIQIERDAGTLTIKPNGEEVDSPGFLTVLGSTLFGRDEPEGPKTNYSIHMPADATLALSTDAADAEVSGLEGTVKIEGVSSSISVRDVDGRVLAGTLSGTLYAEDVRGKLLVGTYSGDLQVRLSTLTDDIQVGSFSGDAEITLPSDAAFDLETDVSWGGSVTSDFVMPDSNAEGGALSIGGGGPTIAFESFTGSLALRAE